MTSPAAPNPTPGTVGFHKLIEAATLELGDFRKTSGHALGIGVLPDQIIDYVRGQLDNGQQREVERLLARSPWALGRVTALVKARRDPGSLGARILATIGEVDPSVWRIPSSGDPDTDLARLLDQI